MKFLLKILGQIIAILIVFSIGGFILFTKTPGNGALCDPEEVLLVITYLLFIISVILFLINSINHHSKNDWKKYRIIMITLTLSMIMLTFSLRMLYFKIAYGNEKYLIENKNGNDVFIKIKLYENGKFFSYTYDASCESENIGTYNISGNNLTFNYANEKSKYLENRYTIDDKELVCKDCDNNEILEFKSLTE